MKSLKKDNERLIYEDVICTASFKDEDTGEKIVNPTDFRLRFYVQGRTAEVICSRSGSGAPKNCKVDEGGKITCFLPKNTFSPGRLIMEDMDAVPCDGFDDGDFETVGRYNTEIIFIE
jgi:hypothetical protein